jgi:hypothetical protein
MPLQSIYCACAPGSGREAQLFADWLNTQAAG